MAVITPSALISEIRGSVGMQTFSKNRYGPYVKAKLVQPPSNTLPQQDVRAAQRAAVAEWQGLTQPVMNKWIDYANENVISGRISRKFARAGYNEYISRCMNRFAVDGAGSGFEPLPKVRLFPIITSVTTAATNITINFDTMKPIGNCDLVVYATPPVSAGINEINPSLYRIIGIITPAAQISSANIYSAYNTYYGLTGADIGKKIGIAIKAINTDNFAAGQFFFVQTTISGGLVSSPPQEVQPPKANAAAATSVSITFNISPPEFSLIILCCRTSSNVTINTPAGFTQLTTLLLTARRISVFYKIAGAAEPTTYTVTCSSLTGFYSYGFNYDNVDQINPITLINNASANNIGNLTSFSAASIPALSLVLIAAAYSFPSFWPISSLNYSSFQREATPTDWEVFIVFLNQYFSAEASLTHSLKFALSSSAYGLSVSFYIKAP